MSTVIKVWQLKDGKLRLVPDTSLTGENRTEPYDLEPWLESEPGVIGTDLAIIGRQVKTSTGEIDLLGVDKSGNTVIIELKREMVPRLAIAQAIDYASDIAGWSPDKLNEQSSAYNGKTIEEALNAAFPETDFENINLNSRQRIVLVGFSIEEPLKRMIEWLSNRFSVNINVVLLSYLKTEKGEELLVRASFQPDEPPISPVRERMKGFIKDVKEFLIRAGFKISGERGMIYGCYIRSEVADDLSYYFFVNWDYPCLRQYRRDEQISEFAWRTETITNFTKEFGDKLIEKIKELQSVSHTE